MAIFISHLLGQVKKTVGNVVMSRVKHRNVARGKSLSVKNPRTPKQVAQRLRMSCLIRLAGRFGGAILPGFLKKSLVDARNEFISRNMAQVSVDDEQQVSVNWEKIICSAGGLCMPDFKALLDSETLKMEFTKRIQISMPGVQNEDDEVYAVVCESQVEEVLICRLGLRGETDPVEMPIPAAWDPEQVYVYGFAVNQKMSSASPTRLIVLQKN